MSNNFVHFSLISFKALYFNFSSFFTVFFLLILSFISCKLSNIEVLNAANIEWICDELGIFQSTSEFIAHTPNQMLDWIEKIDDLSLKYNRARQNAITQEITEIVAGAEG